MNARRIFRRRLAALVLYPFKVAAAVRSQAEFSNANENNAAAQPPVAPPRDLTVAATLVTHLAIASMATLLISLAHAQLTKYARTKNFVWTEHYDRPISPGNPTNALKILIRGAEGQGLPNDQVRITTARIEHFPITGKGTNLVAITPLCLFDPYAHTLTSTDRVDIIARDSAVVVNGSAGFRFDMTNTTLHVSNRVRTTIQGSLLKSGRLLNP